MLLKCLASILLLTLFTNRVDAQKLQNLKDINIVWYQFYQAFDSLDYKPMAKIHSKELLRISGGKRILDYKTYIESYKKQFKNAKENNITNIISLRFFERINNDSIASERGIYKLVRNKDKIDEQTYYGQFHVILKKENAIWKITMDYDSNESNSIGEDEYNEAHGINELTKFIHK
ncbi:nuclear transport factor 2 family protein [Aureibaculum conchae]|uniref:nuclear transport factor 2 family protein n=1 Tax=Aureibaculum sp. 2308TA14-22 TaxID=3108392 RepID=UPI003398128C